jgi:hypothetical protein
VPTVCDYTHHDLTCIRLGHSPGFIAIHCVRLLLEGGYRVRATVRSLDKGEYIAELLGKRYSGKFDYVVVEDLEPRTVWPVCCTLRRRSTSTRRAVLWTRSLTLR